MSTELTHREGHDIRELSESGHGTWAGRGAAALGLTGDVDLADLKAVSNLGADDEDREDEPEPMPWETPKYAAEGRAVAERLRYDGLPSSQSSSSTASGSSM